MADSRTLSELPAKITYVPNFITVEEETQLLQRIYDVPMSRWTQLSNRRLQNWGGTPHAKGMLQEAVPAWLQQYMDKITQTGAFSDVKPNHCLVNEYNPGQGIMPHEDGNMFYPTVSTITLGSHGVLDFYKHVNQTDSLSQGGEQCMSLEDRLVGSILLERCSLVLVQEHMYTSYLHGIKELTCDHLTETISNLDMTQYKNGETITRGTRVSMTIRNVPKVISASRVSSLFGKQRR